MCFVGIPLSTTHCQVGATCGVGWLEGKNGVNMFLLLKVIGGWLVTLLVVGFTAAAFFAQGAYAPSIINLRTINRYEQGLVDISDTLAKTLDAISIDDVNAANEAFLNNKNDDSSAQIQFVEGLVANVEQC